ncbi:hypothetical protein E8D34_07220 [Nocardioides sp. GY 10113]|uniref:hypothetical protein n=1 Tax=Nocardioides sp. GY 10113 TaxID=2569761 RepID=UPI0010A7EBF9|nr:hypothetical protein [Nocardioides sp. GY 10113]TIC88071.1 hypothetical protein E8D34_07220 [Nocardioides sp. GY 10113]
MKFPTIKARSSRALPIGAVAVGLAVATLAAVGPARAATSAEVPFGCAFGASEFVYATAASFSASFTGASTAKVSVKLDEMPNTAPAILSFEDREFVGEMETTVGGSPVTLTGSRRGDFHGGVNVPMPPMSGTVTGAAKRLAVEVDSLKLTVVDLAEIPCTLEVPVSVDVPVVATTTSKATATYKKRKAKLVTTVKAVAGTPTGKVTYLVKRGTKKVASEKVPLAKGKATLVLTKAKVRKKGKYTVKVTYPASTYFTKSTAKTSFKVT